MGPTMIREFFFVIMVAEAFRGRGRRSILLIPLPFSFLRIYHEHHILDYIYIITAILYIYISSQP